MREHISPPSPAGHFHFVFRAGDDNGGSTRLPERILIKDTIETRRSTLNERYIQYHQEGKEKEKVPFIQIYIMHWRDFSRTFYLLYRQFYTVLNGPFIN